MITTALAQAAEVVNPADTGMELYNLVGIMTLFICVTVAFIVFQVCETKREQARRRK